MTQREEQGTDMYEYVLRYYVRPRAGARFDRF